MGNVMQRYFRCVTSPPVEVFAGGGRGRELFEKSPSRKNFDWWGGRAKGVRSSGKLKRGERFLERLMASGPA